VEGISQIGGAVSTIISATDYIANYFAGNTSAQVSYIWVNPGPLSNKYTLWLLDNFDPECCVPSYKDTLNFFDEEGNHLRTISGLNFSQTVGGHRAIAVSPNGDYALVSDQGDYKTGRLSRYEISGELTWTINQNIDSVVISQNGYAYALTSKGTIYGDRLLLIDPVTGQILKEVTQGGFDLVVDEVHNAVWLVGKDIKKLTLDYQLQFAITPIEWVAVSVDYASDGSLWVAERKHPDISESRTRFFNVSPNGDILLSVELSSEPFCLRVDRNDNSIWVATNDGVYKFDKTGKQILKLNDSNVWTISVNQEDESIWAASYSGVAHYSKNGDKLIMLTDFSNDQKYIELPYQLLTLGLNGTRENIGKIAFSCSYNSTWQICTMNADGSNQTRLTNTSNGALSPAWSPDGQKIAFLSYKNEKYDVYIMNADGSQLTQLFHDGTNIDWSPDSKKIVFDSNRESGSEIYVIDIDSKNITKISDDPQNAHSPLWSPDGKSIAFVSNREGNPEIYTMDADGSNLNRLTNNDASDLLQGWSPDGKKLAFISNRDGNVELYVMDRDGNHPTRLTFDPSVDKWASWSPDGKRIAFTREISDNNYEGFVMNADGSEQIQIATDPVLAWSPDGSKIVFSSSHDGSEQLYIIDYDGSNQTRLTQNLGGNRWPSWHR
jgi:Tol biopolymer transport system component